MDSKERHKLKQNEFAVFTMSVADRIALHRTKVVAAVAILAVLLVIAGGVMAWRSHQANEAGAMLGVAMATAGSQIVPASSLPGATQAAGTFPTEQTRSEAAIAGFNAVVAAYPGTDAARMASFQAASELLAAGRAAEAEQAFAAVAEDEGDSVRGQAARLGRAEALLVLDRTDEALQVYTDLAAERDGPMPTDGLLMQLGRASERAGRAAEARAAFQRVVDEFPESFFVEDARQQLASMN